MKEAVTTDARPESPERPEQASKDTKRATQQRFWRRYFEFYDTLNESLAYQQMNEQHVTLLQPTAEDVVLDAGTGTGNLAALLVKTGARVVAFDFFEEALEISRRKAPEVSFHLGDLTGRLDFEDNTFDKIVCCNVIYTLEPADQDNAVSELFRVLKPGGLAAITVFGVGFRSLKVYAESLRLQYRATGLFATIGTALKSTVNTARILYYVQRIKRQRESGTYTFYTRESFTALLEKGGFDVERIEPTLAAQCMLALVRKPA